MTYENEIIIGLIGGVTTAVGWMLGGKQSSKRKNTEVISSGAEKLIQTSQGLLNYLEKSRDKAEIEKIDCKAKLSEYGVMLKDQNLRIEKQDKIIAEMKKQIKINQ